MHRIVFIFSTMLMTVSPLSAQSIGLSPTNDVATTFAAVPAQDGQIGSTMTLEQLQQAAKKAEQPPEPMQVSAAAEPSPALKYRLYPAKWELRPGSALLHYTRAQIMYLQMPEEKRNEWDQWLSQENNPSDGELAAGVAALHNIYAELHDLAMSDDLMWDHRIRDLRGPAMYNYLLPDVQATRAMKRLLQLKIKLQLRQRDFDGVCSSISDNLRLGEFAGHGETLIQKLVGVSIVSITLDDIHDVISTPGCPNLYWALATIPQSLVNVNEAVLWELSSIQNALPALGEAETATWTETEAIRKWNSLLDDLKTLDDFGSGSRQTQLALAIASATSGDAARERLLANGFSAERISNLPTIQIIMIDATKELNRVGDDLGKAHLLPAFLAAPLLKREDEKFQKWIGANRTSSVGAAIGGLLFPSVRHTRLAETRMLLRYSRLMTLEALRMHAATHSGELPKSLDELDPVPAMPDPYTGKPLDYKIETEAGMKTVVLTAAEPLNDKALQELRVQFK